MHISFKKLSYFLAIIAISATSSSQSYIHVGYYGPGYWAPGWGCSPYSYGCRNDGSAVAASLGGFAVGAALGSAINSDPRSAAEIEHDRERAQEIRIAREKRADEARIERLERIKKQEEAAEELRLERKKKREEAEAERLEQKRIRLEAKAAQKLEQEEQRTAKKLKNAHQKNSAASQQELKIPAAAA